MARRTSLRAFPGTRPLGFIGSVISQEFWACIQNGIYLFTLTTKHSMLKCLLLTPGTEVGFS